MYNLNRLRETFLIQSSILDEVEIGASKIRAAYPNYTITIFKQSETESIIQVWHNYTFND